MCVCVFVVVGGGGGGGVGVGVGIVVEYYEKGERYMLCLADSVVLQTDSVGRQCCGFA